MRHRFLLPLGFEQAELLQAVERRIDRPARQAGRGHDVEAEPAAGRDRVENRRPRRS